MDNLPISEWSDKKALDFLVLSCIGDRRKKGMDAIGHSDHTVNGTEAKRIERIVNHVTAEIGRFTVEDALKVIKNRKQLDVAIVRYGNNTPLWLERLVRGILSGEIKLTGGQCLTAEDLQNIDLLGLFTEMTERFNFKEGMVYQSIAEHLDINGYDSTSHNNGYSPGAETVRKWIQKLNDQLDLDTKKGKRKKRLKQKSGKKDHNT